jgi:hypothetical protein
MPALAILHLNGMHVSTALFNVGYNTFNSKLFAL